MFATPFAAATQLLAGYVGPHEKKNETKETALWVKESLSVTIAQVAPKLTMVTFAVGETTTAVPVDWASFDLSFPLEDIPSAAKEQFFALMDLKLALPIKEVARPNANESVRRDTEGLRTQKDIKREIPTETSRRPADMPDFEDEYEVLPKQPQAGVHPIGDSDLYPPGIPKHPLLTPFVDPLAPAGGMHPSRDHPIFGQPRRGNASRLGVVPGARFDDPLGEDNLQDMGMGLPGNMRGPPGFGPPGFDGPPGFGGLSGFGGPGTFGGSGFGI